MGRRECLVYRRLLSRLVVNLMWNSVLSPFLKGSLESFKAAILRGTFKPRTFAGSMHKRCDQTFFTSRQNLQICSETSNRYYDVILHNLSRHEGLEVQNTRGSQFQKGCQLSWVWPGSLRCSLWWISPRIFNFDVSCEAQPWYRFSKKSGMCLDIRHDWLLQICLQVSAPCFPNFSEKKSFQATLFRHQICAALILSFIFKLPLESCNSQMLCLL